MSRTHLKLTPANTDILGLEKKLTLAKNIVAFGGRTTVVRAACGISRESALMLHREVKGKQATGGYHLPKDNEWHVKSPQNCIHASIFCNIFINLARRCKASKAEIYVSSYRLYLEQIDQISPIVDINRAWHLVQQMSDGRIEQTECSCCRLLFVANKDYPHRFRLCPICETRKDNLGRIKYLPLAKVEKNRKTQARNRIPKNYH
jgi:hypothetical protein